MTPPSAQRPMIYRWDLDKTYLRTEFDSLRDLLRTAFEPAQAKRTVPGASVLMKCLGRAEGGRIEILSGSPEQMRKRIEAKLRLDGVQWDSLTLKPSLKQIMRGRLRYAKDQVLYKLGALLSARAGANPEMDEVLFGDDAEADAFIYSLYADICAGAVLNQELMDVLREARVYEEEIPVLVRKAARVPQRDAVRRIFIHLERMRDPEGFEVLGTRVCPFYNYFQPALVLLGDGRLTGYEALRVGGALVARHGFTPEALLASCMDLVARGYIGRRVGDSLVACADELAGQAEFPARDAVLSFLSELGSELGEMPEGVAVPPRPEIDYVGLFSEESARAHRAKERAKWRRGD